MRIGTYDNAVASS